MNIMESMMMALKNIKESKMRTFLTMLGIIIGVGAVIVIVGLGNGLENYVEDTFASLGTNTLTVSLQSRGATRTMDEDDVYALIAKHPEDFEYCSPSASVFGSAKIGSETLTATKISGVSEDYDKIKDLTVERGRWLTYGDVYRRSHVCVVGKYVDQTHFLGNSMGQSVRIGGQLYTVVGVLSQQADEMEEGGSDDCIFVPYSTAARTSGRITSYTITVKDEENVTSSRKTLEDELYKFFDSDDFYTVISMSEMLDSMTSLIDIMVGVLAGIAAISLVVGGIGIMNIMLVSVTERTREIGIRKSLGAKERYIMEQFVIEAATTSALGGVIGIGLGYALSALATKIVTAVADQPLTVTPSVGAVFMAFGISVGIGILFGYLPAKKAAKLNPIDALRYE